MKTIIIIILSLFTISGYTQKIVENKKDEFTKENIIRTDWEKISSTSNLYINVRISKVNNSSFLEIKVVTNTVTSINTDDDISFMFKDGSIISLRSNQYHLSNYGDGSVGLIGSKALGLSIDCLLSESDINKFKNDFVTKIRINKSEGYSEEDIKPKNSEKLNKMFGLIYQ